MMKLRKYRQGGREVAILKEELEAMKKDLKKTNVELGPILEGRHCTPQQAKTKFPLGKSF